MIDVGGLNGALGCVYNFAVNIIFQFIKAATNETVTLLLTTWTWCCQYQLMSAYDLNMKHFSQNNHFCQQADYNNEIDSSVCLCLRYNPVICHAD